MAYSITIGVWGTILYLVFQLFKLKKLGVKKLEVKKNLSKPVRAE
jgi:hypothetical protein